ncbi:helix-turn-helix transcriptional regulator [Streptomyces sp. CT34]|uniref:helix-turn-helix domain-containing protein n=1 Tax=Streptomyces sp. CT34 TaxID=1553907 RepID=UPI0005B93C3C|nr:helix-turn-helix transcriptional regulator [Streptomyces sp. CT34]
MPRIREVDPGEGIEQYIGNVVRDARVDKARAKAEGHDWTQSYLARRVFVSQTRISEVETGDVPPDRDLAGKLETALDLPRDSLTNLVRILEQQTVRDYAKPYLMRQEKARMIHTAGSIVPGLLQTPDYARELMLAGQAGDPTGIDSYVEQRMARQKVWDREHPPWMSGVIDEAALCHASTAQLERLLEVQERPNITIQVLPFGSGPVNGIIAILTLPSGIRGAYTEGFYTGNYSEDIAEVIKYQRVYDRYAARSLTAEASTDKFNEALKRSK